MSLTAKMLLTFAMHFGFLVSYPDTGPMGLPFLIISLVAWSVFVGVSDHPIENLRRDLAVFLTCTTFLCMAAATAAFMPQEDGVSVFSKIEEGRFPDRKSVYRGLLRIGVDYRPLNR